MDPRLARPPGASVVSATMASAAGTDAVGSQYLVQLWGYGLHWQAVATMCVVLGGYTVFNTLMQCVFYRARRNATKSWKAQPDVSESFENEARWNSWWLPAITTPRRVHGVLAPHHRLYPTVSHVSCRRLWLVESRGVR